MSRIEGTLTFHKGSYFEGIVEHVNLSVGSNTPLSVDVFVETKLAGQKMEVNFHRNPHLTKIFIGKKLLINCTNFRIHMDVKNPSTFELKVTGLPTFSDSRSKTPKPFVFR